MATGTLRTLDALADDVVAAASRRGGAPSAALAAELDGRVGLAGTATSGGDRLDDANRLDDPDRLVDLVEHLVGVVGGPDGALRRGPRPPGVVYTPAGLARALTAIALDGSVVLDGTLAEGGCSVVDPACGAGRFLLAALDLLARRDPHVATDARGARRRALSRLLGIEVDPLAAHGARLALWLAVGDPDLDPADVARHVVVGDALAMGEAELGRPALVVGNPPFLSPLRRSTRATGGGPAPDLGDGSVAGAYTDTAVRFLAWAHDLVRPDGGRVLLVQPVSLLGARDAEGTRRSIEAERSLRGLWVDDGRAFDAAVHTVAPLLERKAGDRRPEEPDPSVRRWVGPDATPSDPAPAPWSERADADPVRAGADREGSSWTHLAASALGVPTTRRATGARRRPGPAAGTVGDLARATADFRDQYYGLVGHVVDTGAGEAGVLDPEALHPDALAALGLAPIVTAGLVDPASCAWGRRSVRLHRRRWRAPAVPVAALADGPLAGWAAARRVPKVLVATQTRVVEAVVDERGGWLPSVPVVTVTAPAERLWHVAAALGAPAVSVIAARRSAGTARSPGAIKLSAGQVARLPLPVDDAAWDEGVALLREAARAVAGAAHDPDPDRAPWRAAMGRFGEAMQAAYGSGDDADVLAWWSSRLPDPFR